MSGHTHEQLSEMRITWGEFGPKDGKPGQKLCEIRTNYFDFMLEKNLVHGLWLEIFKQYREGVGLLKIKERLKL